MRIVKEYIDGFRLIDGNTSSIPFEKESEQYRVLIAAGCEVSYLNESELDPAVQYEQTKTFIDGTYKQQIREIIGSIPQSEIDTWPKQEAQALAWKADNEVEVPFIQNLATGRGMGLSELVARILAKAAIYEDLSSKALGQKHASEDLAGL